MRERVGIALRVAAYQMFEAGIEFDVICAEIRQLNQICDGYVLADDVDAVINRLIIN